MRCFWDGNSWGQLPFISQRMQTAYSNQCRGSKRDKNPDSDPSHSVRSHNWPRGSVSWIQSRKKCRGWIFRVEWDRALTPMKITIITITHLFIVGIICLSKIAVIKVSEKPLLGIYLTLSIH
jgi:hypothetical protein